MGWECSASYERTLTGGSSTSGSASSPWVTRLKVEVLGERAEDGPREGCLTDVSHCVQAGLRRE
jgi:hypothetical protein